MKIVVLAGGLSTERNVSLSSGTMVAQALRPCPMLENPETIREIIAKTGAHSTDLQSPESVEHLTEKTEPYARNWTPSANELWQCSHNCAACVGHPEEK